MYASVLDGFCARFVQVNVELGDRENTADGSFMRTTMHRRRRTSSASEAEEEAKDAGKGNPSKRKGNAGMLYSCLCLLAAV